MAKKDAFYFSHDYGARNDPKLIKVFMKFGHAGKGIYWDLIEMMYEQGGCLKLSECDNYAFALRIDISIINSLIFNFDLFKVTGDKIWSESVNRRLSLRQEKSDKAKQSADARWKKKDNANASENNANALKDNANASENNAIKESKSNKIKESKSNKIKESKSNKIKESVNGFIAPSDDDILNCFIKSSAKYKWTVAFCKIKSERFKQIYKGDWEQSKNTDWETKIQLWIIDEKNPELEIDLTNKISDGRNIPDTPDNGFYKSLQKMEDKQKVQKKWKSAGYYYKNTGFTSEMGWYKSLLPDPTYKDAIIPSTIGKE